MVGFAVYFYRQKETRFPAEGKNLSGRRKILYGQKERMVPLRTKERIKQRIK